MYHIRDGCRMGLDTVGRLKVELPTLRASLILAYCAPTVNYKFLGGALIKRFSQAVCRFAIGQNDDFVRCKCSGQRFAPSNSEPLEQVGILLL